jgi:hypothetical protein
MLLLRRSIIFGVVKVKAKPYSSETAYPHSNRGPDNRDSTRDFASRRKILLVPIIGTKLQHGKARGKNFNPAFSKTVVRIQSKLLEIAFHTQRGVLPE